MAAHGRIQDPQVEDASKIYSSFGPRTSHVRIASDAACAPLPGGPVWSSSIVITNQPPLPQRLLPPDERQLCGGRGNAGNGCAGVQRDLQCAADCR